MLGKLGRRTRRQSESNRKKVASTSKSSKSKRKRNGKPAELRKPAEKQLAVRTFLKPAHTWNRHASLKHFIEQNDESPRGHPGHSTMARPSGPNAGSAHVLRAPSPKKCKNKRSKTHTESGPPFFWGADPHRPCPPIGPMLLLISSRTPSAATSHGSCWSGTRKACPVLLISPYRTWKRSVLKNNNQKKQLTAS